MARGGGSFVAGSSMATRSRYDGATQRSNYHRVLTFSTIVLLSERNPVVTMSHFAR